jgi:hypothetical protein
MAVPLAAAPGATWAPAWACAAAASPPAAAEAWAAAHAAAPAAPGAPAVLAAAQAAARWAAFSQAQAAAAESAPAAPARAPASEQAVWAAAVAAPAAAFPAAAAAAAAVVVAAQATVAGAAPASGPLPAWLAAEEGHLIGTAAAAPLKAAASLLHGWAGARRVPLASAARRRRRRSWPLARHRRLHARPWQLRWPGCLPAACAEPPGEGLSLCLHCCPRRPPPAPSWPRDRRAAAPQARQACHRRLRPFASGQLGPRPPASAAGSAGPRCGASLRGCVRGLRN